ncbi:MAG: amidase, partial [Gammaproteobacteria bacterium]|nr:amidase [Gammaproteobacteria bacterium]
QAAAWLEDAGYRVESIAPPDVGVVADLWARIGMDDVIARMLPDVRAHGDEAIKIAVGHWYDGYKRAHPDSGPQTVLDALIERETCLRRWQLFLQDHPLVLMPSSGEQAFPNDLDIQGVAEYERIWRAQLPQLLVPVLGLPAIAVPTGVHKGLPVGVQLVSARFREDLCLDAAEIIEAQANMPYPFD